LALLKGWEKTYLRNAKEQQERDKPEPGQGEPPQWLDENWLLIFHFEAKPAHWFYQGFDIGAATEQYWLGLSDAERSQIELERGNLKARDEQSAKRLADQLAELTKLQQEIEND
jgi:hypothetical protein